MENILKLDLKDGIRDIDAKSRIISGYLSQVEVEDKVMDVIDSKAFNMTLAERKNDIFFLNQHDWSQPHGKFASLEVDSYGLKFVSNPLPNTSFSNDTLELIEKGIVTTNSIGYVVTKSINEGNVRRIKELKLYEGSTVTLAANDGAIITGLKSMTFDELKDKEKLFLKAFRSGKFTDDTFTLLELAIKELQMQFYELGKQDALHESKKYAQKEVDSAELQTLFTNFKF
jgi:HK97 family phage prohead protease